MEVFRSAIFMYIALPALDKLLHTRVYKFKVYVTQTEQMEFL